MQNTISNAVERKRLPRNILICYALGQAGWSLASYNVGSLLAYFYAPPENGQPTFPVFLPVFIFLV